MDAMRAPVRAIVLLGAAVASRALGQASGWESFGPALFQTAAVAAGSDEQTVYAGSSDYAAGQSAVFRSVNAGHQWTTLVQAPSGQFYSDLLVDPRDSSTLYAGAPGNDGTTTVYRSSDAGANWLLGQAIPAYCVPSLAPGSAAGVALVSCGTLLYRTLDAGRTWESVANPFTEPTRLATGPGGLLLAYGTTRIFRSTNDGDAWTPAGSAPAACPGLTALRVDPTNASVFVAGAGLTGAGGFQCGGIFRSTNAGASWTASSLSGVSITDVAIDAARPSRVYASAGSLGGILPNGGVYASFDGGVTFSNTQLPALGAQRLAVSASGNLLYAATSLGVFTLTAPAGPPTCTQDDVTLCLNAARFRVRAVWTKPDSSSGPGHAVTLTGDTGDFWFFDSSNVEVIVKVLEGCGVNGHRWVFASGLTNVQVILTVTDVRTGAGQTYTNPQGTAFAPIQDTSAFPCN